MRKRTPSPRGSTGSLKESEQRALDQQHEEIGEEGTEVDRTERGKPPSDRLDEPIGEQIHRTHPGAVAAGAEPAADDADQNSVRDYRAYRHDGEPQPCAPVGV